jgi:transposase-like protein
MADESGKVSKRARQREATRARRLATAERRQTLFELVVSGHSYEAIARETGLSPSALRRDVGKTIETRRIEAPERYVHLQVARIEKALLAADAAIERGDVRAVSQYLKVVAALDRYHGLAAALTPPEPASAAASATPARRRPAAGAHPRRPVARSGRFGRGGDRRTARKMAPNALKGFLRVTDLSPPRRGKLRGQ